MSTPSLQPTRVLLLAAAVLAPAFVIYQFFLAPWQDYQRQIRALEHQLEDKEEEIRSIRRLQPQLRRWQLQSLPADLYAARGEYGRYLDQLLRRARVTELSIAPANLVLSAPGRLGTKKPVYLPVGYSADFKTTWANLLRLLEDFQKTPLVQKIRDLKVEPVEAGKAGDLLKVHLAVEALRLEGADAEQPLLVAADGPLVQLDALSPLLGLPTGLALVAQVPSPLRDYAVLARWNLFTGPQLFAKVPEKRNLLSLSRFVFLTRISQDENGLQASLYDRWNNQVVRVQPRPPGNQFRILDSDGKELFRGEVLRIDPLDVYFRVGFGVFALHLGQNIQEAMRRPLPPEQLEFLGLRGPEENPEFP
jgi:hypothetical protein